MEVAKSLGGYMKKLFTLFVALLVAAGLTACSKTSDKPTETPSGTETKGKVAVFYYDFADTYLSTVRTAMEKEFMAAGIEFTQNDAANNQSTENDQIDTAITQGVSLLIVNIVDTGSKDAAKAIVDKAKAADIPVIFFNREFDADDNSVINSYEKAFYIGTDPAEAGHMQGKLAGEYLLANYDKYDLNGDGVISYAMFKGELGNPEADFRTLYGQEDADKLLVAAGKSPLAFYDAKNTDKFIAANWDAGLANGAMQTILTEYNDATGNMVEAIFCNNDGMAEGVISALNVVGYNDGGEKAIPVFGVDATDAAKQLIADGKMAGTIKQDAEAMASTIVAAAKNALEGKAFNEGQNFTLDQGTAKARIAYAAYTGE